MAIEREMPNLPQNIIKSHFKGAKSRSEKAPSHSTMERKTKVQNRRVRVAGSTLEKEYRRLLAFLTVSRVFIMMSAESERS